MILTTKHYYYYYFGNKAKEVGNNLLSERLWEAIRMDCEETPFSIPGDRNVWIEKCIKNIEVVKRA